MASETCGTCNRPMADDGDGYGKAIGCEHCNRVFCSAECSDVHEKGVSNA